MTRARDLPSQLIGGDLTIPTTYITLTRQLITRRGEPTWIADMLGLNTNTTKPNTE
jgi:hypothetical protein